MGAPYSEDFVAWVRERPLSRRAKYAVERIIETGYVTTADLNAMGYDHPPRAIGDIKDAGIKVKKRMVLVDGRRMARYELDPAEGANADMIGRRALGKAFRDRLFQVWKFRCAVCDGRFTSRELQADHRVPYRIAGEPESVTPEEFMPLCPSCNRAKSWSCETCLNWVRKEVEVCKSCLWASPNDYSHVATLPERRLYVTWSGEGEISKFDAFVAAAKGEGRSAVEEIKCKIARLVRD